MKHKDNLYEKDKFENEDHIEKIKPTKNEEKEQESLGFEGKEKRRFYLGLVTGALGFFAVSKLTDNKNKAYADATDAPLLTTANVHLLAISGSIASVATSVKTQIDNFNNYVKPFTDSYAAIKSVFVSWNSLINEMNSVMDAVQKSRDFLKTLFTNDDYLFKQAQQIYSYVCNLTNGDSDWAKIRFNNIDFYSQALVMRYEAISSKYQSMRSAWGNASKHPYSAPQKIFIYTANQQVENSYYEYRSHAYKMQFEEIQKKVAQDDAAQKLPQGKSQNDIVNEISKNLIPQILIDQLNVQTQTLKVATMMLQNTTGLQPVLPEHQVMPGNADFANAFSKAKNGETYSPLQNGNH